MKDQYAVIGNPIKHSKSPFIHAEFARQTQQDMNYSAVLGEPGQLNVTVSELIENNGKGFNITVPFKQDAWELVNQRNPNAEKAGAVNTIIVDGSQLIGDNTDGVGLVNDLSSNLHVTLKKKRILILGAGGAVRGVISPILKINPDALFIANRTVSKAKDLEALFSDEGKIFSCGFADLNNEKFDVIINGTAASLGGELPPVPDELYEGTCCYDMMYGKTDTVFMAHAKKNGAMNAFDGLGMLVEQAAESFKIWRGVRPETKSVIEKVRASF